MVDFSINEMQRRLQDKYKDQWEPICPETGKNKMLWMIGDRLCHLVIIYF